MTAQATARENSSIRTEIAVGESGCPAVSATEDTGGRVTEVNKSTVTGEDGEVVEEFSIDAEGGELKDEYIEVFGFSSSSVYRFERDRDRSCVCDKIEESGCPVSEIKAEDGVLYVTFYASDIDQIKGVMDSLDEAFADVHIRELVRSDDRASDDLVFLDRGNLTARQFEVMETAYEMGYFDHAEGANAGEVAEALGISPSTFTEHISLAQTKILDRYLDS